MNEKIYVIGHKSPDLDSAVAAISYAKLKNELHKSDKYIPALAGKANKETKYILDKNSIEMPLSLDEAQGNELILVDHNEASQSVSGVENARVLEILDHHKIDFKSSEPISITLRPWGSSCTIIADMFFEYNIEIEESLAKAMLAAVLVDTVITKSPTCTEQDKDIIERLAKVAKVEDWQAYGMEIFKVRSNISELSNIDIIKSDFKDFNFKQGKFGIGQVETADLDQFKSREDELIEEMEKLRSEGAYHSLVLFLTDIINVGSKFLIVTGDPDKMKEAVGKALENKRVYLEGIISRKKQVAPMMLEVFDK